MEKNVFFISTVLKKVTRGFPEKDYDDDEDEDDFEDDDDDEDDDDNNDDANADDEDALRCVVGVTADSGAVHPIIGINAMRAAGTIRHTAVSMDTQLFPWRRGEE